MISIVFFSVSTLISALASSIDLLYVGDLLSGIGIGVEIAAVTAFVSGISSAPLRERAGGTTALWDFAGLALVAFWRSCSYRIFMTAGASFA